MLWIGRLCREFPFITFGFVDTIRFSTLIDRILTENGLLWDTAGLYTTGEVTLLDAPGYPLGDFNNDGVVDGDDLPMWQGGFGISSGAMLANGDADLDGDVDGNDFLTWQTGFGSGPGATDISVPVPEPASIGLALLAVTGMFCVRTGHPIT